jgi:hypothetical protein
VTSGRVYPPNDARRPEIPVFSDGDLRRAIAVLAARGDDAETANPYGRGAGIVIAAPIYPATPYIIPPRARGISIRGAGYPPITPLAAMAYLFLVDAVAVTLEHLMCSAKSTSIFATTFAQVGDSDFAGDFFTMRDNICVNDRVFVDTVGASRAQILWNRQNSVSGTFSAPIVADGRARIIGNELDDGGGDAITLTANASRCVVMLNHCDGADITTSASGGLNSISSNTSVAAVNRHLTDKVGSNT